MSVVEIPDLPQRERALDPAASFIVQAPAGSGKTELLIQRFLVLLGRVDCPEEIAAITFTRKAAAEMRKRVFEALDAARSSPRPVATHEARTWDLAAGALARDRERGWQLRENAARLKIQTFDALCASLTRQMPVLSRFGAQPESLEDAGALYVEAARNTIGALDEAGPAADDVEQFLLHLDNDAANAVELLASMLAQRDHWMRAIGKAGGRASLERALAQAREDAIARAAALFPASAGIKPPPEDDSEGWVALAHELLTKKNEWRKTHPTAKALSGNERLRLALCAVRAAPPPGYSEAQWQALGAITRLLPRAISELKLVFAARGQADFVEIAQGALRALGEPDAPTDLLLALDYRIRHLLVDEFQDTSFSQLDLLRKLTAGWEPEDGRTLFVVGDPMQSIYRFRQAEVALFLEAQHQGIGGVPLEPLTLSANFRSHARLVEWFNRAFVEVMPAEEDVSVGAVPYSPSSAVHPERPEGFRFHAFIAEDSGAEADRVVEVAREALQEEVARGTASVAILARNRRHLSEILPRLKAAGLSYRAIEIEPLGHRPVVQDLLALTRALSHLADRTAWLSILRAPWCGLTLADLHALAGNEQGRVEGSAPAGIATVWEAMNDPVAVARLSADGQERLARVAAVVGDRLRHRRRRSLRESVEGAWLALGGPACVESATDLEDAEIYLDHLEETEEGGAIPDLPAFELGVAALYALPDLEAGEGLQVMTIHKAKGLEFDTVIVPGLERGTERDDRKLFLWTETASDPGLLLAPVNPTGSKDDAIYEYIRGLEKGKADHECGRLLYVAATRARRTLHLLGSARLDKQGLVKKPAKGSLLEKLWPVVEGHFEGVAPARAQADAVAAAVREFPDALVRLREEVRVQVEGPAWTPVGEAPDRDPIEFSWVGETARHVGSVVHRWLQRIAEEEMRDWSRARIEASRAAIRNALAHRGVAPGEVDAATDRVTTALAACLEDPRGRWLLGAQSEARNEHRLTAIVDGRARVLVIDRMFTDAEGRRRIVDYKTSRHEGGDVESFLAEEQRRYRAQLERYAQAALPRETVALGLYFPLLGGWREWSVPSPAQPAAGRPGRGQLPLSFDGPSESRLE